MIAMPRLSILYVCDDPEERAVVTMVLRALGGFFVQSCCHGSDAATAALQFGPDLVLLDVGEPEAQAIATMKRLQRQEASAAIPVVLVAARNAPADIEYFKARGAVTVIGKPIAPMQLPAALGKICQAAVVEARQPPAPACPPGLPEALPEALPDYSALQMLVIDDDVIQLALVVAALRRLGVGKVSEAASGAAGLVLLGQPGVHFDIVLTDLRMAGLDGIEFMRHAVDFEVGAFALASALDENLLASAAAVVRGYGAELLGTLAKPLGMASLRKMLAEYQERGRGAAAALMAAPLRSWSRAQLAEALRLRQFVPYFQPKFNMASNIVEGAEILARWQHPTLGLIAPQEFIEVMEQTGLIDELTYALFEQSLVCAREWREDGVELDLALNISPHTLERQDMPRRLMALCGEYGLATSGITIEMTETAVASNPKGVLESITRLRVNGFKVSIDDFGTGYSSLSQLSCIPFTELKIDRSFVAGMPANSKSLPILVSILQLGEKLGLRTVAEGIETEGEREFLRSLGCSVGQGYLFAKPMSQADLRTWLPRHRAARIISNRGG